MGPNKRCQSLEYETAQTFMENDLIPFCANDSWICSLSNSLSNYFRLTKTPPPSDYADNIEFIQLSLSLIANCPVEEWMHYDFIQLQKKLSDNIYKLLTLPPSLPSVTDIVPFLYPSKVPIMRINGYSSCQRMTSTSKTIYSQ